MRTTINIDGELLAKATKLAGPMDRTAIVSEGLKAFIQRETARRVARLEGTQPTLNATPRRAVQAPGQSRLTLVDTSVWVDHLRRGDPGLLDLLERSAGYCAG